MLKGSVNIYLKNSSRFLQITWSRWSNAIKANVQSLCVALPIPIRDLLIFLNLYTWLVKNSIGLAKHNTPATNMVKSVVGRVSDINLLFAFLLCLKDLISLIKNSLRYLMCLSELSVTYSHKSVYLIFVCKLACYVQFITIKAVVMV